MQFVGECSPKGEEINFIYILARETFWASHCLPGAFSQKLLHTRLPSIEIMEGNTPALLHIWPPSFMQFTGMREDNRCRCNPPRRQHSLPLMQYSILFMEDLATERCYKQEAFDYMHAASCVFALPGLYECGTGILTSSMHIHPPPTIFVAKQNCQNRGRAS